MAAQSRAPESGRLASLWRLPDVAEAVMELLEPFGLAGRRDELAENLSHGEQRYLEICLALATQPDPPDARRAHGWHDTGRDQKATELIRRIAQARGLTVLLIEHDMSVVMGISDRIAVLHFGEEDRRRVRPRRSARDPAGRSTHTSAAPTTDC